MGEVKRMHFVPRTYLKRFGFVDSGKDRIHMLPKNDFFCPIKAVGQEDICVEKEIYSIAKPGEKCDPAVEHLFAQIFDKEYATIYKRLVQDKLTAVTYLDMYSIIAWITSMFLRNRQIKGFC